jgi:hypothetical protein
LCVSLNLIDSIPPNANPIPFETMENNLHCQLCFKGKDSYTSRFQQRSFERYEKKIESVCVSHEIFILLFAQYVWLGLGTKSELMQHERKRNQINFNSNLGFLFLTCCHGCYTYTFLTYIHVFVSFTSVIYRASNIFENNLRKRINYRISRANCCC